MMRNSLQRSVSVVGSSPTVLRCYSCKDAVSESTCTSAENKRLCEEDGIAESSCYKFRINNKVCAYHKLHATTCWTPRCAQYGTPTPYMSRVRDLNINNSKINVTFMREGECLIVQTRRDKDHLSKSQVRQHLSIYVAYYVTLGNVTFVTWAPDSTIAGFWLARWFLTFAPPKFICRLTENVPYVDVLITYNTFVG